MRVKTTRLTLINQHYEPDVAATGQALADLAGFLVTRGYQIKVVCGRGSYVSGQLRSPAREIRGGVRIRRLWTTAFRRQSHVGRLTNYAVFYVQVFLALLVSKRTDGVILLTTPPLLSYIGRLILSLRRQRYAIWSMDLHPDAEVAAGMLQPDGFASRFLHGLSDSAYRSADFVVALGEHMKRRIAARLPETDNIRVISMWARKSDVEPVASSDNPLVARFNPDQRIVLTYSGNAGIAHRFSEILSAIDRLVDDNRFRFLFIGDGPKRERIEEYITQRNIERFMYLDYFPREQLRSSLALGDIHFVCLKPEFAGIAVPAKLFGIMAAARPVLFVGPQRCETADIIRQAGCGAVVDPDDEPAPVDRIVEILNQWAREPEQRHELGRAGRQSFLAGYERDHCCSEFERVIREFWQRPCHP